MSSQETTAAAEAGRAREQLGELKKRLRSVEAQHAKLEQQLATDRQESDQAAAETLLAGGQPGKNCMFNKRFGKLENQLADATHEIEILERAIALAQSRLTFVQQDELLEQAQSLLPEYSNSVRRLCNALDEQAAALAEHERAVEVLKREGVTGGLGLKVLSTDELTRHHGQ